MANIYERHNYIKNTIDKTKHELDMKLGYDSSNNRR